MKMGIGVLLYPVGKSPCSKAEIPVSFDLFDVSYLIVVEVKRIF